MELVGRLGKGGGVGGLNTILDCECNEHNFFPSIPVNSPWPFSLYLPLQTTNSVDPVAMMKHSMSGISDQQVGIHTHTHTHTHTYT